MPFPITTLFKLIVGRPSRIATPFRSIISLANTGKYRPLINLVRLLMEETVE